MTAKFRIVPKEELSRVQKGHFVEMEHEFLEDQLKRFGLRLSPSRLLGRELKILVATAGSELAGFITFFQENDHLKLICGYVRPRFQNKTLARQLVSNAIAFAQTHSREKPKIVSWRRSKTGKEFLAGIRKPHQKKTVFSAKKHLGK